MSSKWLWPRGKTSRYSSLGQGEYQGDVDATGQTLKESLSVHSARIIIFLLIINLVTSLATLLGQTLSTKTTTPQRLLNSPFPICEHYCHQTRKCIELIQNIVPTEIKTFQLDPLFMERPSAESDAAWEELGGRKYEHVDHCS